MKLVIGLGNLGEKYENTRHNAGFLAVDYIFDRIMNCELKIKNCTQWKLDKKSNTLLFMCHSEPSSESNQKRSRSRNKFGMIEEKIILAKPQTFMNNSGVSIKSLVTRYALRVTNDIIIIHDDIDIAFGKVKKQTSRGSAGHNGIKSIIEHLGTNNFTRIRIGILPPDIDKAYIDTAKFVLKKFNKHELQELEEHVFPKVMQEIY